MCSHRKRISKRNICLAIYENYRNDNNRCRNFQKLKAWFRHRKFFSSLLGNALLVLLIPFIRPTRVLQFVSNDKYLLANFYRYSLISVCMYVYVCYIMNICIQVRILPKKIYKKFKFLS